MRLGQLSRKVNIKSTEILSYLKNEFDIELGSHFNTKVEDDIAEKVISKFTVKPVEVTAPTIPVKTEVIEIPVTEVENEVVEEIEQEEEIVPKPIKEFEVNQEVDASTILNAELIKAPKVELPGPKVIGKIELPPTLEEQMVEVDGVMMSRAEIANRKKEERKARKEKSQSGSRRSTTKVRESRIKSEAQLDQIKRDKDADKMATRLAHREKRITQNIKKTTKTKSTFIPKKAKKRTVTEALKEEQNVVQKPKPTTWHGKLWLWFNT